MILSGLGKPTKKRYDQTDDFMMIAHKRLTDFFKPEIPQISIRDHNMNENGDFRFKFDADFQLKSYNPPQLAAKYFYKKFSKNGYPKCNVNIPFDVNSFFSGSVNGQPVYFLFASNREICELLYQRGYKEERCNTATISDYIPGIGLTKAIGTEIWDMFDENSLELETHFKNKDLFDHYGTEAIISKFGHNAHCLDVNNVRTKIHAITKGYALIVYQRDLNTYKHELKRIECQNLKGKKHWKKSFIQKDEVCQFTQSGHFCK
jgi:hypothetical protein